ncbi:carbohydrate binding domain-containing protein [Prosthecobacter fluviatilis]|uniref:Carbohydrate binding domain-containing protein n=1 Tax=Prosthecobacter fluviatilis TaxID=445931 RepID=A0ABW0KWB2_9BACT
MNTAAKLIVCAAAFGTLFALAAAQQPTVVKTNLLSNPSFENGLEGWTLSAYEKRGTVAVDTVEKHDGKSSIRIENPAGDDSFLQQTVTVKPRTRYRLTGYIKTRDVVVKGTGATLSLAGGYEHTEAFSGKQNWKKVSFEFDTGAQDSIKVGPRLGHHSSMAMGTAWFDELQLIELGPSRKR